jgi:hypothetical protein
VRAQLEVHRRHARLGGLHLELALAHVVEVLRGAHDHVDDRPDEREEDRRGRRAADQHGVGDPPSRVRVRPVRQREVDHDEEEDHEVDGQVEAVRLDPEDREHRRKATQRGYRKSRPNT